jgi:hypothetical protein
MSYHPMRAAAGQALLCRERAAGLARDILAARKRRGQAARIGADLRRRGSVARGSRLPVQVLRAAAVRAGVGGYGGVVRAAEWWPGAGGSFIVARSAELSAVVAALGRLPWSEVSYKGVGSSLADVSAARAGAVLRLMRAAVGDSAGGLRLRLPGLGRAVCLGEWGSGGGRFYLHNVAGAYHFSRSFPF